MKTIYNTYVVMESQEQCDRMKQLCIDNNLPICKAYDGFEFNEDYHIFEFSFGNFEVWSNYGYDNKKVTEQEFIELLKQNL